MVSYEMRQNKAYKQALRFNFARIIKKLIKNNNTHKQQLVQVHQLISSEMALMIQNAFKFYAVRVNKMEEENNNDYINIKNDKLISYINRVNFQYSFDTISQTQYQVNKLNIYNNLKKILIKYPKSQYIIINKEIKSFINC